jgi:hypothetical protein
MNKYMLAPLAIDISGIIMVPSQAHALWEWDGWNRWNGWNGWNWNQGWKNGWNGYQQGGPSYNTIWTIGYNQGYVDGSTGAIITPGPSAKDINKVLQQAKIMSSEQQPSQEQQSTSASNSYSQSNPNVHVTVNNILPSNGEYGYQK